MLRMKKKSFGTLRDKGDFSHITLLLVLMLMFSEYKSLVLVFLPLCFKIYTLRGVDELLC